MFFVPIYCIFSDSYCNIPAYKVYRYSSKPQGHIFFFMLNWTEYEISTTQYVHEVLVNRLFKLAKEKLWLGELTVT